MIGVLIKNLGSWRALPEIMLDGNGERSPTRRLIDGKRTKIHYNNGDSKSFCFLADLSGLEEFLSENEAIIDYYTPEELFGYTRQVIIDDIPQWDVQQGQVEETYLEETGSNQVEITALEKQVTPGWEWVSVQNRDEDPLNDIPDGQFIPGWHDELQFTGTPEIVGEDTLYPPKYTMVEVGTGEYYAEPVFTEQTRMVDTVTRTPITEDINHSPPARAQYLQCYDRSPVDSIVPPMICGLIMGYEAGHLLDE